MIEQDLKALIVERYGNLKKFTEAINLPWTTLDGVLKRGVNKANITSLIKICDGLKIDCESLYYGKIMPKQYFTNSSSLTEHELNHIKKYRSLDPLDKKAIDGLLDTLSHRQEQAAEFIQLESPILLPYYGRIVSAGTGQYVFDDIPPEMIEVENTHINIQANFAVCVNGDSMEPTYSDGDVLLIKKQPSVNVGEIGIFMINGEAFVKEFAGEFLKSHNDKYEDIPVTDQTICLGKVINKIDEVK